MDCDNCKNLIHTLSHSRIQKFIVSGWNVAVSEKVGWGNRLNVSVSFDIEYIENNCIQIPKTLEERLRPDDCDGNKYAELLGWLLKHPINEYNWSNYELEKEENTNNSRWNYYRIKIE
jgi:hypothetical protein